MTFRFLLFSTQRVYMRAFQNFAFYIIKKFIVMSMKIKNPNGKKKQKTKYFSRMVYQSFVCSTLTKDLNDNLPIFHILSFSSVKRMQVIKSHYQEKSNK